MNTEVHGMISSRSMIGAKWKTLYFATIGAFAGYLGSVVILGADIATAKLMGFAPFMFLRYYATLREGPGALLMSSRGFLLNAIAMHLAVGSALGAIFVLIVSGRDIQRFTHYLAAGIGFGLCVWFINFYLLLSWIQPLVNGKSYILENIPWWVAGVTHALYGISIALVSYAFRNDVEKI
jgi:hypothetical protein